jgi:RecA-family ATPase
MPGKRQPAGQKMRNNLMKNNLSTGARKPNFANLPPYIEERLAQPPMGKGNRHQEMLDLSAMMTGERIADEQQFAILRQRYPDRDKSDRELRNLIAGARERGFTPAATSRHQSHYRRDAGSSPEIKGNIVHFTLSGDPAGDVPQGQQLRPLDFLKKAFHPGEAICLNNETAERAGKETITGHGHFRTIDEWEAKFTEWGHDMLDGSAGCWVRINPFLDGTEKGEDDNVSSYRNLLVEFDSRSKSEQWRIYKESGLPIRFVIDSGGDSLHAWVAVDANGPEQFKERQQAVYDYLSLYLDDKGNKNPSRFSRLPGVKRGEKTAYQTLVAENIGAVSWAIWEEENTNDGLPEIKNAGELAKTPLVLRPEIVEGVLRTKAKFIIGAASKGNKTWTLIDFGLSAANGIDWLGFKVRKSRVLFVNLELPEDTFRDRLENAICPAKGLDPATALENFDVLNLRGYATSYKTLVPKILGKMRSRQYDLVILDPTYKILGDADENKATDVTDMMNALETICTQTDAAIVLSAHFSKGNKSQTQSGDRVSGSGVFLRDPDAYMEMIEHEEDDVMTVELKLREFPKVKPFTIKWEGSIFTRTDADPAKLKKQNGRPTSDDHKTMLKVLGNRGLKFSDWKGECDDDHGISESSFKRNLKKLDNEGKIEKGPGGLWQAVADLEKQSDGTVGFVVS